MHACTERQYIEFLYRERERQKKVTLTTDMTIPLVEEVYKDYSTAVVVLNRENRRGRSVCVVCFWE